MRRGRGRRRPIRGGTISASGGTTSARTTPTASAVAAGGTANKPLRLVRSLQTSSVSMTWSAMSGSGRRIATTAIMTCADGWLGLGRGRQLQSRLPRRIVFRRSKEPPLGASQRGPLPLAAPRYRLPGRPHAFRWPLVRGTPRILTATIRGSVRSRSKLFVRGDQKPGDRRCILQGPPLVHEEPNTANEPPRFFKVSSSRF